MSNQSAVVVQHGTPAIPVRRMDFEFDDGVPKYWLAGNHFASMLLTGLSCTFPEGERMFMRSVRHYQDRLTDPELIKAVRAFIGQEAHHGKEHTEFNAMMGRKGLPTADVEAFVKEGIRYEEKQYSSERMLAKTCALEHFTAMFAEQILSQPEMLELIDERVRPLWLWHAVEESEHKSVAFDVYQDQVGDYWVRTSEMALTTVLFTFFSGLHAAQLLHASREDRTPLQAVRDFGKGVSMLWGSKGLLRGTMKQYLEYYRRDFHPSQRDSSVLRARGLHLLKSYIGDRLPVAA